MTRKTFITAWERRARRKLHARAKVTSTRQLSSLTRSRTTSPAPFWTDIYPYGRAKGCSSIVQSHASSSSRNTFLTGIGTCYLGTALQYSRTRAHDSIMRTKRAALPAQIKPKPLKALFGDFILLFLLVTSNALHCTINLMLTNLAIAYHCIHCQALLLMARLNWACLYYYHRKYVISYIFTAIYDAKLAYNLFLVVQAP